MGERKTRGRPANEAAPTRAKLLAAAAAIFNTDGYFATDTNKIARAAGFAPATFYRHFRDKRHIFLEAYAHWVGTDWAIIEAAVRAGPSPRNIARKMVAAYLAHHGKWVQFRLSMHGLVATDPEARAFHLKARAEQLKRLQALLSTAGAPRHAPGDLLYSFLSIERAANAVTDGDIDALGIFRKEVVKRIENEIVYLLTGKAAG